MPALQVIAMICMVHPGSPWARISKVDAYQAECQKSLITCYEKSFPQEAPGDQNQWYGALKDCIKNRKVGG